VELGHTLLKLELCQTRKRTLVTEMETVGYVWTLRKTQKWLSTSEKSLVILSTDHKSVVDIKMAGRLLGKGLTGTGQFRTGQQG
jgi:hypothetical protein